MKELKRWQELVIAILALLFGLVVFIFLFFQMAR